jgi:GTP-binding protein
VFSAFLVTLPLPAALRSLFRKHFRLEGAPVRVEFRADENPFKGRRNPLTPRQVRSRKRLMKRVER